MNKMKSRFYKWIRKISLVLFYITFLVTGYSWANEENKFASAKNKIEYGKLILNQSLEKAGYDDLFIKQKIKFSINPKLFSGEHNSAESYSIKIDSSIDITGIDSAGVLYACIDIAERINQNGRLPDNLEFTDSPDMKLRGTCILLMKLGTYNYPLTPKEYPFFYNKKLWLKYLDFLAENRFNYVALWNGHPFDYFVKLDEYPEAQDGMNASVLQENHNLLKWLISEGAKRNIKFFFEFYNIHTSVYFQKAHKLPEEISVPTEQLADYTRYCIQKFVKEFPEVGLYITAGEALDKKYAVSWVNDVLLTAINSTGQTPTVFLRSWYLKLEDAKKTFQNYPDLYIESKYNVEMIADTLADPMNKNWAALNGNLIMNIHMAGNLEPFRWNPHLYIQKCLKNSAKVGANGLHLYPRKPWRWPNVNEIGSHEYQWTRDELWFKMWGRYAWNYNRSSKTEKLFWENYFAGKYDSKDAAKHLLKSYELEADVLPSLQRLFWAGNDNHTVLTSGLMLTQIQKSKGIPFLSLDPVERIPEYLNDLAVKRKTQKISPIDFLEGKLESADQAIKELEIALSKINKNKDEVEKYILDAKATDLTSKFYYAKLNAAVYFTLYKAGINSVANSKRFLETLKRSVDIYQELTDLTTGFYESISDVPATHPVPIKKAPFHWKDILPLYEKEYAVYENDINQNFDFIANLPKYKGLIAVLFGDPKLVKPKRILDVQNLDFDWDNNPPDDGRNWSVQLNGFIKSPVTGNVYFRLESKQSSLIKIDGKPVIEKDVNPYKKSAKIKLIKDKWYPVTVEYDNVDFKGSNLKIRWSLDGKKYLKIGPADLKFSDYNKSRADRMIVLGF